MRRARRYWWAVVLVVVVALGWLPPPPGRPGTRSAPYGGLSSSQRASLLAIARDTWKFYGADVDQATSLPMDNITFAGGSATPTSFGHYTSAANIGVYLWAVVAARDLGLISEPGPGHGSPADARPRCRASSGSTASCTSGTTPPTAGC